MLNKKDTEGGSRDSLPIEVVSSNIRYDDPEDIPYSWEQRKEILADLVQKNRPHIIATQEGWYGQIEDLVVLLPNHVLCDQHRQWDKQRMYPNFFLDSSRVKILQSGDRWLSETPEISGSKSFESVWPRLMCWAIVRLVDRPVPIELFLVNVHLDHIQAKTRAAQAKVLAQQIKLLNTARLPLILMGDFNDYPDSETRQVIMGNLPRLYDPWERLNKKEKPSFHAFGCTSEGPRIDWVLLDNRLQAEAIDLDYTCEEKLGSGQVRKIYPSDHYPLRCRFKLNQQEG